MPARQLCGTIVSLFLEFRLHVPVTTIDAVLMAAKWFRRSRTGGPEPSELDPAAQLASEPSDFDSAPQLASELAYLDAFLASQAAVGQSEGEARFAAIAAMVRASSPRMLLRTVQDDLWLLSDEAQAAWSLTAAFVQHLQLPMAEAIVADRMAWIAQLRQINALPERMQLPDD
jgi:hypothetical protein